MSTATAASAPLKLPAFAALRGVTRPTRPSGRRAVRSVALDTATVFVAVAVVLGMANPRLIPDRFDALLSAPITLLHVLGLIGLSVALPLFFRAFGMYRIRPGDSHKAETLRVAGAMAACTAVAAIPALAGLWHVRFVDLFGVWGLGTAMLLTTRMVWRAMRRSRRLRTPRRILIVGAGPRGAAIRDALSADEQGCEIVGFIDDDPAVPAPPRVAAHIIGGMTSLESLLMQHAVDEVFIALPVKSQYRQIEEALRTCERVGVCAKYRADLFETELAWPKYEPADGHVVTMQVAPDDYRLTVKRLIDVAGSAVLLVLLAPVMVASAVAVKITSPGPIFFAQERFGLNRRRFRMLKFRTMVVNAEQLQSMLEDRNEVDGPVFKISNDPRVTPVGRCLRRTSLDELPQLFNVLWGDMSLVGPRPLPLRDVQRFTRAGDIRRCSVRPGITCLWQVSGRNNLTFDQWMRLDLQYIDGWSLLLDFEILARTLPAVLKRTGAH